MKTPAFDPQIATILTRTHQGFLSEHLDKMGAAGHVDARELRRLQWCLESLIEASRADSRADTLKEFEDALLRVNGMTHEDHPTLKTTVRNAATMHVLERLRQHRANRK